MGRSGQPAQSGPGGLWGPFRALEGSPGGPREGSLEPRTSKIPKMGISQTQTPPRGGFYINPSRRGPGVPPSLRD